MSTEETTGQIEVVEQPAKPKQIIKINYKKLYIKEKERNNNLEAKLEQKNNELLIIMPTNYNFKENWYEVILPLLNTQKDLVKNYVIF